MIVRRAEPTDAAALVALANEVSAEPEGWLISTGWRGITEERRFIRAVRRHPDAAVIVAELDGEIVGRLSLARDVHPASGHVADLGLMVDARHRRQGVGRALMEAATQWARENGVTKLELHVFPVERARDRALRTPRLRARGLPEEPLRPGRRLRRRRADGARGLERGEPQLRPARGSREEPCPLRA